MFYLARLVTHREVVNKFGKIGTPLYIEYFKTTDEAVIQATNKRKKIKFKETHRADIIAKLDKLEANTVYWEKVRENDW